MLSPHLSDVEEPFRLGKSRLEPLSALSRSTPQLNSAMATQTEINAKESEVLKEKVRLLMAKREQLCAMLEEKLAALRETCIAEAEITGVLPSEFPVIQGQPLPRIKKRVGTEYTLSSKFLEKNATKTGDAIERLELEVEIQNQIMTAALKLSEDKTLSKPVRKKHRLDYLRQHEKLKSMKDTLDQYRIERGRTARIAKTTDDVDQKMKWKKDEADNSEPCYRTLPNPHRRRPVTPQPQSVSSSAIGSQPVYKMSHVVSDSVLPSMDTCSISSNSSTLSINQMRADVPSTMMYQQDVPSYVLSRAYLQHSGMQVASHNQVPYNNFHRRKGSASPSTVESSDLTSSCSSSLSSLQLNAAVDGGSYNPYQDNQLKATDAFEVESGLDPMDYSSYLRNTQKAYYSSPSGRFGCGSLDRKKMVRKHSSRASNQSGNLQITELAELTPSKFGSKRESAVDSQDSPFQFEDSSYSSVNPKMNQLANEIRNSSDSRSYHAPPFGRLKESSSESSGVYSGISTDNLSERSAATPQGKRHLHFQRSDEAPEKNFGGPYPQNNENKHFYSERTTGTNSQLYPKQRNSKNAPYYPEQISEMSDIHEYSASLRNVQQKQQELCGGLKPASSVGSSDYRTESMTRPKRTKPPGNADSTRTQSRKPPSNIGSEEDAVDALFRHNNQQSHLNSLAFDGARRISDGPQQNRLRGYPSSSSSSSLSSFSSNNSTSQPLRFVKVTSPSDSTYVGNRNVSSSSSSTLVPSPFDVTGCSTLV